MKEREIEKSEREEGFERKKKKIKRNLKRTKKV